ncbi:uncharacterized protein [Parasteatoda tepidariorum]|uniref:uncharacterized protein n=1 Tax=Parasteatoda tepidariorum TaxID=114398 RepID=UPI0039BCF54B
MPVIIKNEKTKPAPELLLAQLILSAILVLVVGHATYEKDYEIPRFVLRIYKNTPYLHEEGKRSIPINEFRTSYTALCLLVVSAAYFFTNLILYLTCKCTLELYNTILILVQDMVFCFLMFICSIAAAAHPGERAIKWRETEILIASGISMFCCVSSGVGVYYSYWVYRGL